MNFVLRLSEHSGGGSPGWKLFVHEVEQLLCEVSDKEHSFYKAELTVASWRGKSFALIESFSNRTLFSGA